MPVISIIACDAQKESMKHLTKNGMNVQWHYRNERVFFEMSAPTEGWVTIGFNITLGTEGAYLLMGNVVNGKPAVIEHYTISAGNYKPITSLGAPANVQDVKGSETNTSTTLNFSLPIKATSNYQRDLTEGSQYTMIIAYSQEDDFQHHSIMRTSISIKL
jgi:hypothetical protein